MTIAVGESGKPVILATGVDLSAATSMTIKLVPPSGPEVIVASDRITAPNVAFDTEDTLGILGAQTYMQFDNVVADFLVSGGYIMCGTYNNTASDPVDIYITLPGAITILEC